MALGFIVARAPFIAPNRIRNNKMAIVFAQQHDPITIILGCSLVVVAIVTGAGCVGLALLLLVSNENSKRGHPFALSLIDIFSLVAVFT